MICLAGNGRFDFDIVGESHYQRNLAKLAGLPTRDGCDVDCLAVLHLEDSNPYDPKAVAVGLARTTNQGLLVGYFPRNFARRFRQEPAVCDAAPGEPVACRAKIVGGWDGGPGDRGLYGVKLDLSWPLRLRTSAVHASWMKRLI